MYSLSSLALAAFASALLLSNPTAPVAASLTIGSLPAQATLPNPLFNLDFSKGDGKNYKTLTSFTDTVGVKRCGVAEFTGGEIHQGSFVDLNVKADTHQDAFPQFSSATGLSWSFSALYTSEQAWQRLFDCGVSQVNHQIDFTRNADTNYLEIEDNDSQSRLSGLQDFGDSYPIGVWQSYGISISADNVFKIYVNGKLSSQGGNQYPIADVARGQCFLGVSLAEFLPNRPDKRMQGYMDRFAFWDSELTAAQFLSLANYDDSCAADYQNPTPGAKGDPQFTGFLGQSYQVHGASDSVYNILSTPNLSYNAHFSYLEEGKCRKGTQCFSHAGNYFSEVALLIHEANNATATVQVVAGSVKDGMNVLVNDEALALHTPITVGLYTLTRDSVYELDVTSSEFNIRISNSDMFLNQDVSIGEGIMQQISSYKQAVKANNMDEAAQIEAKLPHGILGQTWSSNTYANRWKHIQGQLFDYQLDTLNSTQFKYTRF